MNIERIKAVITMLGNVSELDMLLWQSNPDNLSTIGYNREEFHACGNKACVGGHIALMPEFQAAGGSVGLGGYPEYKAGTSLRASGGAAIAQWLEVPTVVGVMLTSHAVSYPDDWDPEDRTDYHMLPHVVYGADWHSVTPEMAIKALNELMEIGVGAFIKRYWDKVDNL